MCILALINTMSKWQQAAELLELLMKDLPDTTVYNFGDFGNKLDFVSLT